MTLGERIDLAREALAQGLAPLPIVLSALEIPRATWYYYRKQKVEADRKREEEELRLKRAIEDWTYAASTCTGNRGLKSRLSLPAMSLRRHW
jgi:hypothetical protein